MRLFLAILLAATLAACGGSTKMATLPAGTPVLAFGDSVTFGFGAGPGEDYPRQLATISGWNVSNAGISGETADAARARINAALEENKPALVLIEIGGNDFLHRRPEAAVKEDIRAIVTAVRQAGATPVLIAVPRAGILNAVAGRLDDSGIYAELAKEERVLLVSSVFSNVLSDAALRSDAIHPNASGYRKLAEGIAAALAKTGLLAKR
ncbi:MAG: GDSL-type esterase/lipase family protein [Betaproteobacteria bacterium]